MVGSSTATMPTRRPRAQPQSGRQNRMSGAAAGLPLRVLIADDSEPVADMLRELISEAGRIEVVGTADSETSTMAAIRSLAPDAVVLDLQLKGGSGTNVIRAVRADT